MTDGLAALTAADVPLVVDGKEYRLAPLRARDYGEIEARIAALRPDPLAVVLPRLLDLPESLARHLLSVAYEDARRGPLVSAEEVSQWLNTISGRLFQFWLALRRNHPELTMDDAEALLLRADAQTPGTLAGNGSGQPSRAPPRRRRAPRSATGGAAGGAGSTGETFFGS